VHREIHIQNKVFKVSQVNAHLWTNHLGQKIHVCHVTHYPTKKMATQEFVCLSKLLIKLKMERHIFLLKEKDPYSYHSTSPFSLKVYPTETQVTY